MLGFYNFSKAFLRIVLSPLLAVLLIFTNSLNFAFNGSIYKYESNSQVVGLESLERAQGVTTDGEAWYFSGKSSLVKIAFNNRTVLAYNYKAIPDELKENCDSQHIGGISYYDGKIYAPLEDSKKWQHPVVAVYNAQTLEFTGEYHELSKDILTRGMSWLACDAENGLIYSSHSKNADVIYCFDINTFEFVKEIKLSEVVEKIQGGDVYNGLLYVGTNDGTRAIYTIDIRTGAVTKIIDRIMYQPKLIDNFGGEGEDVTVYPMDDGTLIHALNLGTLFIDANLRHYKWNSQN